MVKITIKDNPDWQDFLGKQKITLELTQSELTFILKLLYANAGLYARSYFLFR